MFQSPLKWLLIVPKVLYFNRLNTSHSSWFGWTCNTFKLTGRRKKEPSHWRFWDITRILFSSIQAILNLHQCRSTKIQIPVHPDFQANKWKPNTGYYRNHVGVVYGGGYFIAHPHLLVRATSKRFLQARATFRSVLASESHWLQPVLVLTVHWWPAPVSVGGLLMNVPTHILIRKNESVKRGRKESTHVEKDMSTRISNS